MLPYPPPRRFKSDNIKRWPLRNRKRVAAMVELLSELNGSTGVWTERDPDEASAWWEAVMRDPRSHLTRLESIPTNHPDASLRLDRCPQGIVTVTCAACRVQAAYELGDLQRSFGDDHNIMRLPGFLLPCMSKRDQRDGRCSPRAEPGGYSFDFAEPFAEGSAFSLEAWALAP